MLLPPLQNWLRTSCYELRLRYGNCMDGAMVGDAVQLRVAAFALELPSLLWKCENSKLTLEVRAHNPQCIASTTSRTVYHSLRISAVWHGLDEGATRLLFWPSNNT